MEQWRDIPGYEGRYQASDLGRVRSLDYVIKSTSRWGSTYHRSHKGRILSMTPWSAGYLTVKLSKQGDKSRVFNVHRLIAPTWLGTCPIGQEVRHGAEGMLDNSINNLCYGTPTENNLDKRRDGTGLSRRVRRSDGKISERLSDAAEASDCRHSGISGVCMKKYGYKTAGGYGWEYV